MYNTRNIALIAILTSLTIVVKYAFGFFAGVEFVTLLIGIYAIFTPLVVSMTTAFAFVLAVGALYGVGTWWIMYFFIWPTEVILGWVFKKWLRKSNILFGVWVAFWGFSMMFWFAIHDTIVFDKVYAYSQMGTALITNVIEAIVNLTVGMLVFYPCKSFFLKKMHFDEHTYW